MIFAALLVAAIMTESNGTFADAPPFAATAVDSPYIPYGTYTDGYGSTEYLRIGTNLVGAVASMIDGFWERVALPYGWLPPAISSNDCPELTYPLRERCRDTKRILATALNAGGYDTNGVNQIRYELEMSLADGYVYETAEPGEWSSWKTNAMHAGVAGAYTEGYIDPNGVRYRNDERDSVVWTSRKADGLFQSARPPIASAWSGELPFKVADTNDWRGVFPVYSAYEFDPHFFPSNYADMVAGPPFLNYARPHLKRWMLAEHVADIWGGDVFGGSTSGTGHALDRALAKIPVATDAIMESVLKVDPGWKYEVPPTLTNDYWTVDGKRLARDHISGNWDDLPNADSAVWSYYFDDGTNELMYIITASYDTTWTYEIYDFNSGESTIYRGTKQSETSVDFEGRIAMKTEFYSDADDFKHWRNMTTRLDWKRLGIIAQLERHMEITYRAREREDYLPLWEFYVRAERGYRGELPLHVKIVGGEIADAYVVGHEPSLSLSYATWTAEDTTQTVATNRIGASYPTARTIAYLDGSSIRATSCPADLTGTISQRDDIILDLLKSELGFISPYPDGVRHYRMWCNFGVEGGSFAGVSVDFGPGDVRWFSVRDTTFVSWNIPDTEDEGVFDLFRGDAKIARDVTTLADNATQEYRIMGRDIPAAYPEVMTEEAVTNLEFRLWNDGYIKSISLPTIEVRLAASNDYWAAQLYAEPAMPYQGQPGDTNVEIRAFRYQQDVANASPLDEFRWQRLVSLRNLDTAVKNHFRNFAGRAITSGLAGRAAFNAAEIAAFDRAVANANARVFVAKTTRDGENWIEGYYDFDHGAFVGNVAVMYNASTNDYGVAVTNAYTLSYTNYNSRTYGSWAVGVTASADAAITNSGVRVDGHQNQMMKTLWKFKNLRDPDL